MKFSAVDISENIIAISNIENFDIDEFSDLVMKSLDYLKKMQDEKNEVEINESDIPY